MIKMGIITDEQVVDAVAHLGTATSSMIFDQILKSTGLTRQRVAQIVCVKLKTLTKYRILEVEVFQNKPWYYLPDNRPADVPKEPPHFASDRLRQHVESMELGQSITVNEAMVITGKSRCHTWEVLQGLRMRHGHHTSVYTKVRI